MPDSTVSALPGLDESYTTLPSETSSESGQQVDKNEFIQLLVTQLQNQDPLDPMSNEDFAVQLAQFSQVEELIAIKDAVQGGSDGTETFSSMASYLGNAVVLGTNVVNGANAANEGLSFTLEGDAAQTTLQLIDSAGNVAFETDLGALSAGKQSLSLADFDLPAGEYTAQIIGLGADGKSFAADPNVLGIVSGYIPGENPALLVGDREISTTDIEEVRAVA